MNVNWHFTQNRTIRKSGPITISGSTKRKKNVLKNSLKVFLRIHDAVCFDIYRNTARYSMHVY